jgi:prevent-host-death family protein
MTKTVNIHEAKTHLSRLVEAAAAGQEIIIAKAGKPVARLGPLDPRPQQKKFDLLKGQFRVPDDFNEPLDESTLAGFEGR